MNWLSENCKICLFLLVLLGLMYFMNNYQPQAQAQIHEEEMEEAPLEEPFDNDIQGQDPLNQMGFDNELLLNDQLNDDDRNLLNRAQNDNLSYDNLMEQDKPQMEKWDETFNSRQPNVVDFQPVDASAETQGRFDSTMPRRSIYNTVHHFNSKDLLPYEDNDPLKGWNETNPKVTNIQNSHLIDPSLYLGINTVGSSRRNASNDLRPSLPNPKTPVSPWMNSSIDPDFNIKPLL